MSPGFEAVAPAMDPGDGDGTRPGGRRLGSRVLAKMPPFTRIKSSRTGTQQVRDESHTADGSTRKNHFVPDSRPTTTLQVCSALSKQPASLNATVGGFD